MNKKQKIMKNVCQEIRKQIKADLIYVTNPANMRRISGFTGEGYLLITAGDCILVTDSRYTIVAKKQCPDWDVVDMSGDRLGTLHRIVAEGKLHALAYEDKDLSCFAFSQCRQAVESGSELTFLPLGDRLTKLRQIKAEEEIEKIERAEAIGDFAFGAILKELKIGMTEKEVAARLEYIMKTNGADGLSFATIAASGEHSAMPHAEPDERKLQIGDFLTMDFGCTYEGYCSDMTRTVVMGKPSEEQVRIYETVRNAQELAIAAIKPGMKCCDVDQVARDYITQAGFGENFGHGLGHCVGLEIHESPAFSPRDNTLLCPGMVITVEPGIYVEGLGGVRIEDVVCITEDGCRNITHSEKKLIEIA